MIKLKSLLRRVFKAPAAPLPPPDTRLYDTLVHAGDLCFDVGANHGDRTAVFVALGARVIAFDPQPSSVQRLQKRFAGNSRVVIEAVGLADKAGTLELMICEDATVLSTFSHDWQTERFKDYAWNSRVNVPVVTLDQMIGRYGRPDFCKIDVEGFEVEVIHGLSVALPLLSFEYTIEFVERAAQVIEHLDTLANYEYAMTIGETHTLDQAVWTDGSSIMATVRQGVPKQWGDIYARQRP